MDESVARPDLLRLVCATLPAHEANALRELDPHDPATLMAAYAAVVRSGVTLPAELNAVLAGEAVSS